MYLPITVPPPGFPVEVEGKGEGDRLGGLLKNLFETLLKNVPSSFFIWLLRPPELPGRDGEFD